MKRKVKTESGFTLLELLISLATVAVIVTFCLMAVRLGIASRETGTQRTDIHQRLRVLHERLNSTLRSAHLIFVSTESESLIPEDNQEKADNSKILAFEGQPESIRFVTFSEKLMRGNSSPWMHEVHIFLKKNEETGLMEILLNERNFSPQSFFKRDSQRLNKGQTLRIAQDVAYLKFRYYNEISEEGISPGSSGEKVIKVSGEWTDKIITEPFDFKSDIGDNKSTGDNQGSVHIPRAVEFSVGLWESDRSEQEQEPLKVELPPTLIPIQAGMIFERLPEEKDESGASKK